MKGKYFSFITVLRALCTLLILYDHLIPGTYIELAGEMPVTPIEQFIIWPLSIVQHFGHFSVVTFFMITGFLILPTSENKNIFEYASKKFINFVPSIILSYRIYRVIKLLLHNNNPADSYFTVNGAFWFMKVELLFYFQFVVFLK